MNSPPKISVVIPAYHAEQTIARTLDSVLSQTFAPYEIIVVDDGSKDGTCRVVEAYAPRVTLVRQPNGGPNAARNNGVRQATGDWIALLDSDDAWLPEKLERQVARIAPDVALVHCYVVDDRDIPEADVTFELLWKRNCIGTSTVVMNKDTFNSVGGFVEDRRFIGAEDYNLWLRLAATGKRIVTVREELSLYTPAEGSLSQQILKVIEGELRNVEAIGADLGIPRTKLNRKRTDIYEEYGRMLFYQRDLLQARRCYREALRGRWNPLSAMFWLATFVPRPLLNLKRQAAFRMASATPRPAIGG